MEAATRNRIEARIQWVEDEMEAVFASRPAGVELYRIQRYHLGWLSARFEPLPRDLARRYGGKKLRGVLCLLACQAAGGAPGAAVPAAAALQPSTEMPLSGRPAAAWQPSHGAQCSQPLLRPLERGEAVRRGEQRDAGDSLLLRRRGVRALSRF